MKMVKNERMVKRFALEAARIAKERGYRIPLAVSIALADAGRDWDTQLRTAVIRELGKRGGRSRAAKVRAEQRRQKALERARDPNAWWNR